MEGRLTFRARLGTKWNAVEHSEGEDVEGLWKNLRVVSEEVCGRRKRLRGKKRTGWWSKEVEAAIRKMKIA